jgi:hypothetical protein
MISEGWIKLHRRIKDHWIWKNPKYFHAWINILMTVNYEDKKVFIYGELIDCSRGQSLLSLNNWADEFGNQWTIKQVRTFFDLLQKDSMILREGLSKTTRITVCNYDSYQDEGQTKGKQKANKRQTKGKQKATTKEGEERKEGEEVIPPIPPQGDCVKTWRTDFNIYRDEIDRIYKLLIIDEDFIKTQEKFNPEVDIILSMDKAITNYWGLEAGWKKKKSDKKLENPDWKATLVNAIGKNRVFKPKYVQQQQYVKREPLKSVL